MRMCRPGAGAHADLLRLRVSENQWSKAAIRRLGPISVKEKSGERAPCLVGKMLFVLAVQRWAPARLCYAAGMGEFPRQTLLSPRHE